VNRRGVNIDKSDTLGEMLPGPHIFTQEKFVDVLKKQALVATARKCQKFTVHKFYFDLGELIRGLIHLGNKINLGLIIF
jgi:hypothetical protein